jgi:hypothetical protein
MTQKDRREVGNSDVVSIPKDKVERRACSEGQRLVSEIDPAEVIPITLLDIWRDEGGSRST